MNIATDLIRALSDIRSGRDWQSKVGTIPHGDGHSVLVFPGFMTNDRSTSTLRKRLVSQGYDARPWDQGINFGQTREKDILHKITDLLKHTYMESSRKVSLVGWSLGGLLAREAARCHPEQVRRVICLGSPIGGSPKHTSLWKVYNIITRLAGRQENVDQLMAQVIKPVEGVHCISIYSDSDGVVPPNIACEEESPLTENIKVNSSHLGLPFNADVLQIISERLSQPEINWKPYAQYNAEKSKQAV